MYVETPGFSRLWEADLGLGTNLDYTGRPCQRGKSKETGRGLGGRERKSSLERGKKATAQIVTC